MYKSGVTRRPAFSFSTPIPSQEGIGVETNKVKFYFNY